MTMAVDEEFTTGEIGPNSTLDKDGKPIEYVFFGKLSYAELGGAIHHTGFAIAVSTHMPAGSSYENPKYSYYD